VTTYNSSAGTNNDGSFYSFGAALSGERALGGVGSTGTYYGSPADAAAAGWIAVALKNDTGGVLQGLSVSFDGEQWRNGGNTSAHTMVFEYGFGTTFASVSSWTAPGTAFNFTSPTVGASSAALDGNLAANRVAGLGGSISSLTWNNSDTLWLRWIERNDTGSDHGLAIDNFSLTAIPEPATYAAVFSVLCLGVVVWRRRRALS
jgi:hypothetical protein